MVSTLGDCTGFLGCIDRGRLVVFRTDGTSKLIQICRRGNLENRNSGVDKRSRGANPGIGQQAGFTDTYCNSMVLRRAI